MMIAMSHLDATLARLWPGCGLGGAPEGETRLQTDSRRVAAGDVFVAVPGVQVDGRDYIDRALADGAVRVLCHTGGGRDYPDDARVVALAGLRERLGELGRLLYGVPDNLELIGVTGTNGKSSVTHYLAELSQALGADAAVIGTLGHGRPGELLDTGLTTPGPLALQASLAELAHQGVARVALEVSSHALEQERLAGCRVRAAVFTNLSRDHLDYHGSMAAYAAAKARLFQRPELELAVVNGDDPLARLMLAGVADGVRVLATGRDEAVTLRVLECTPHATGQRALIATPQGERELVLPLVGRFNLDNVLLAMATLLGRGHDLEALIEAAANLVPVPGRMEVLAHPGAPTVVIDYAHTPDALDSALEALRDHLPGRGELWCLFGCGGDRDAGKRAPMAAAAERHADRLVVTDDNPRSEDPGAIRDQVLAGVSEEGRRKAWDISGRGAAIRQTLREAGPEDVVLVAGKGHETYQEIAGVRHPFDDRKVAEQALQARCTGGTAS